MRWIPSVIKPACSRLPSLAAIFVALVCLAILEMSGWGEWSARETRQDAGTEMANLARSLTQHAEDSLDLLTPASLATGW